MGRKILLGCAIAVGVVVVGIPVAFFLMGLFFMPRMKGASPSTPPGLQTPRVVAGQGVLSAVPLYRSTKLGAITSIAYGELDPKPGTEIGIACESGAVFTDTSGTQRSALKFGGLMNETDIVDVNHDGICEFLERGSWGQKPILYNHKGKVEWKYASKWGVDDTAVGDINGDGRPEFAVGLNGGGGVLLIDARRKIIWRQPDGNVWHVEMVDVNNDSNLEIVHSNAGGQITIRNANGRIISQAKPTAYFSNFSLCKWPSSTSKQYPLLAEKNKVWLFDYNGANILKLDAPKSEDMGEAIGTPVKLASKAPEYLAVVVRQDRWQRSMLYLYDSKGKLLFEEILKGGRSSLAKVPGSKTGVENLLVSTEDSVRMYTLAHP